MPSSELLEPGDLRLGEWLEGEVAQRRTAPELQRVAQQFEAVGGSARSAARDEPFGARDVELRRVGAEGVAGRLGDEAVLAEELAQPRDVDLDALGRSTRRRRAPQFVSEAVGRDRLVGVQQQHRKQRPLLDAAELRAEPGIDDLEWAEQPEIHV